MRRLVVISVLVAAVGVGVTAAAGAGDQRVALGGGVSIRLPAGWHLTHGKGTPVSEPFPRLSAATFPVRFSKQYCVCATPHVMNFPHDGAFLFVWEYAVVARRDDKMFPAHTTHFHISRSAIRSGDCSPSDGRLFRQAGRGYQAEIYLGPDAPASARAQIASILDSWQVTSTATG